MFDIILITIGISYLVGSSIFLYNLMKQGFFNEFIENDRGND